MNTLKVAVVQYPLGANISPEKFLEKIESYLVMYKNKADLLVFPELITTEQANANSPVKYEDQLLQIAENFTPKYLEWLKEKSKEHDVNIMGGTTPRLVGSKVYNTAVLALTDGRLLLQDKIFLTPDEKEWQWTPGDTLNVFETPWGKTVITICFDSEFPVVSSLLVDENPEVIIVPSWTSSESGLNRVDWSSKARAIEHYAYVIKTGTVPPKGESADLFGLASIISPQETGFPVKVIEGTLNADETVVGKLDLEKLRTFRKKTGYCPAKEQSLRTKTIKVKRN